MKMVSHSVFLLLLLCLKREKGSFRCKNEKFLVAISGLLTHMEQMRMDPKHQFAAQYVLSRAAAERRERDSILAAAAVAAMAQAGNHPFGSQVSNYVASCRGIAGENCL